MPWIGFFSAVLVGVQRHCVAVSASAPVVSSDLGAARGIDSDQRDLLVACGAPLAVLAEGVGLL